jgi:uncharacterized membrane protein YhaH (DUF805 family)
MPIFLYWSLPLILLFVISVVLKTPNGIIVFTFILAYLGMIVTLIRALIIDRDTTRNKNKHRSQTYN